MKVCTALTNIPEESIFPLIDFSGKHLRPPVYDKMFKDESTLVIALTLSARDSSAVGILGMDATECAPGKLHPFDLFILLLGGE